MDNQHTPVPTTARRPGRRIVAGLLVALGGSVALGTVAGPASADPGPGIPAVDPVGGGRPSASIPAREVGSGPRVTIPKGPRQIELKPDVSPIRPPADGFRVDDHDDPVRRGEPPVKDREDLTDPDRFRVDQDALDRARPGLDDLVRDDDGVDGVDEAVQEEEEVDDAGEPVVDGDEPMPPADGEADTAGTAVEGTGVEGSAAGSDTTATSGDEPRADALAFTGSDVALPLIALALIGGGGLLAALATVARRVRAQA